MKISFYFLHRIGVWAREQLRRGPGRAVANAMAVAFILASLHEVAYRTVFAGAPGWVANISTILMSMLAAGATVWLALLAYRHMARQQDDEVAARQRLNRELIEERSMLRAMMDGTQDMIYFKDKESRFLRINEAMAERFGLRSPTDALGKTDFCFFPPQLAEQKMEDERRVMGSGSAMIAREEHDIARDGQQTWVSTSKMPLRDKQGAVVGTFGISRDITALKEVEEQQKASIRGLQRILEIADELIACEDEDTLFRRAVELARTKLELERCSIFIAEGDRIRGTFGTNVRGETTDERNHTFVRAGLWEERLRRREPHEKRWSMSNETYHDWRNSETVEVGHGLVAITPLQSSKHDVIGVFCNDNAISKRPLDPGRQEIVAVYCSLVGNIVARKRAELEHRQAADTQRSIMERTDRLNAVGLLAAGMAHEINNPLQGMLSHLRALQPYVPPESAGRRNLDMAQKGIETIASLVRRLLMLGSTGDDAGRDGADVQEAVEFVAQLLESQFRRVQVRIEREISTSGARAAMPRAELIQILMNLLINARDAMPGGGTVRISATAGGGTVSLVVADTGQGIAPELMGRIFAPFFTTKGSKGTGLGLSVTESLVRSHNGTISVESEPGRGTTFRINLPRFQGEQT